MYFGNVKARRAVDKALVTDVALVRDYVEFTSNNTEYVYVPTKGGLYIGGAGTVIHQAPDGSFDFGQASGNDVAFHAKVLGATISVKRR